MEKDKLVVHGGVGGLPPTVARCSSLSATSSSFVPAKCEALASSSAGLFSHDISGMTDYPSKNVGHRRAHSEILCLPDDISFGSDLGVVGSAGGPSLSDETEDDVLSMYLDMDKFMFSGSTLGSETSLTASAPIAPSIQQDNAGDTYGQRPRVRHQHSQSMDDSTIKSEILTSGTEGMSLVEPKKAISAEKLADLALIDPKRAKRIWANRQSAARSKERKMRYIGELERKVQTLQTEATTLSTQLSMLQRDNTGLNAENSELKLRVQTMEQQVRLQDALNNSLRDEVQRLKVATGQPLANGGQMMNYGQSSFGLGQQNYHLNHSMQSILAAQQLKQLQIHSQHQQNVYTQQHQLQQSMQSAELKTRGVIAQQMERDSASDNCNRTE